MSAPHATTLSVGRLVAVVLVVTTAVAPLGTTTARKNLVLISLDTLRPDRMSAYGHKRPTTPFLESLPAIVFDNVFSTASWTTPAHAAMLTGRYIASVPHPPGPQFFKTAVRTIGERFQAAGYRTAAIVGGGNVSAGWGANRGFDDFEESALANDEGTRAATWLTEHATDQPFFLFVHTYWPHAPYDDDRFVKDPPRKGMAHIHARYDSDVAAADDLVATIWKHLDPETTVVIITSDHGEEFKEHTGHSSWHGHTLHGELLRIPLMWIEHGLPAQRLSALVSVIDIVPTVVERFGLQPDPALDGKSLDPLLRGQPWGYDDRIIFSARHYGDAEGWRATGPTGSLIEPNLVAAKERPPAYYSSDDRKELKNKYDPEDPVVAGLSAALQAHRARWRKPDGADTKSPAPTHTPSEKLRAQLEALGYVAPGVLKE